MNIRRNSASASFSADSYGGAGAGSCGNGSVAPRPATAPDGGHEVFDVRCGCCDLAFHVALRTSSRAHLCMRVRECCLAPLAKKTRRCVAAARTAEPSSAPHLPRHAERKTLLARHMHMRAHHVRLVVPTQSTCAARDYLPHDEHECAARAPRPSAYVHHRTVVRAFEHGQDVARGALEGRQQ